MFYKIVEDSIPIRKRLQTCLQTRLQMRQVGLAKTPFSSQTSQLTIFCSEVYLPIVDWLFSPEVVDNVLPCLGSQGLERSEEILCDSKGLLEHYPVNCLMTVSCDDSFYNILLVDFLIFISRYFLLSFPLPVVRDPSQ